MTYEIWGCRTCDWRGVLPERDNEDDFSCPQCGGSETAFEELTTVTLSGEDLINEES